MFSVYSLSLPHTAIAIHLELSEIRLDGASRVMQGLALSGWYEGSPLWAERGGEELEVHSLTNVLSPSSYA